MPYTLQSVESHEQYSDDQIRYRADNGEVLEVKHDFSALRDAITAQTFDNRLGTLHGPHASGVWRYKDLVLPLQDDDIVSKPEGNTNLYPVGKAEKTGYSKVGAYTGGEYIYLKHEGENPTGSFKDRGMTVGVSKAKSLGATAVACASTGNTSAALASYGAQAGMKAFVFIPAGKIAFGKLSQSLAYGATTIQIEGDFDRAMALVEEVCNEFSIYLLNSVNPFRIEGQKTIGFEILQQLNWEVPDWIVIPAGNLGNTSAIGKGMFELKELGIISKLPRIASIQAQGANPFYTSYKDGFRSFAPVEADTIATAIKIGNPISYIRARHVIEETNGVVEEVTDQEIVDAKAQVDAAGIGCEPGSATSVAGMKKLISAGVIKPSERVVGILTGNILKDPDTTVRYHSGSLEGLESSYQNTIVNVDADLKSVAGVIEGMLK
jgi:threonine synthase